MNDPAWKRAAERAVGAVRALHGSYDSVTPGPADTRAGSQRPGAAWAHLDEQTHLKTVAAARDAGRNMATARAAVAALEAMAVGGYGPRVDFYGGDGPADAALAEAWGLYAASSPTVDGTMTLAQALSALVGSVLIDGDAGVHWVLDGAPMMELIEAPRISTPTKRPKNAVCGVQMDGDGRVLGYHVGRWSAGGLSVSGHVFRGRGDFTLLKNPLTPGQVGAVRGESQVQAALPLLRRLQHAQNAAVFAHELATYLSIAVVSPTPGQLTGMTAALSAAAEGSPGPGGGRPASYSEVDLPIGMPVAVQLPEGARIEQTKPESPGDNFDALTRSLVTQAFAAMGVPVNLGLKDVDETSYSGLKGSVQLVWPSVEALQQSVEHQVLRPLVARWLAWMRASGRISAAQAASKARVRWPTPPVFELGAEVDACLRAVDGHLMTLEEANDRLSGRSWRGETAGEIAAEQRTARGLGLVRASPVGGGRLVPAGEAEDQKRAARSG